MTLCGQLIVMPGLLLTQKYLSNNTRGSIYRKVSSWLLYNSDITPRDLIPTKDL